MRVETFVAGVMMAGSILWVTGCACPVPVSHQQSDEPCASAVSQEQKSLQIVADDMAVDQKAGTVTYEGNVQITTEGGVLIEAEKVVVTPPMDVE